MTRTNLYNKNSNMLERFVIEGVWYVNDMSISDGIFGQLNYNPEKIILELKGSFTNNLIENSTIYGFSTDGNYILLEDCFIVSIADSLSHSCGI
ncbi:ApeA N-terminal domain 1-containing protein [Enterococcus olivae]